MKITVKELANALDGLIYPLDNWTNHWLEKARNSNIIVMYGRMNEVAIIRGHIEDEIGIYNGMDCTLERYHFDNKELKKILQHHLELKILTNGQIIIDDEVIYENEEHKHIKYSFLPNENKNNLEYAHFRLMDDEQIESYGLIVKLS